MLKLPSLISSGMILQRNTPIHIWGWADKAAKVTINFLGKESACSANDSDGRWQMALPPVEAGGPHTMTVMSGDEQITLDDILIGDVWVCSGQSNMELPMSRVAPLYPDEMRNADCNGIRQFLVTRAYRYDHEEADFPGAVWEYVTADTLPRFYAASYFFAKELYARYGVPIGLINSAAGGSSIEAWMSEAAYTEVRGEAPAEIAPYRDYPQIDNQKQTDAGKIEAWTHELDSHDTGLKDSWQSGGFDGEAFDPTGDWAGHPSLSKNGAFWFKATFQIPENYDGNEVPLLLGCIRDADTAYVNGVKVGETAYQYPPRRYTVPADILRPGENTLVVRVISHRGVGGFVPGKEYSIAGTKLDNWRVAAGAVMDEPLPFAVFFEHFPTGLWNSMMAPAVHFAVKGVIWYQGESNTGRPVGYRKLFETLVNDWRRRFGINEMPFIFTQLANFKTPYRFESWPVLREQQRQCLDIPYTAMAVTIDIGEPNDLHPLNKYDLGRRLALAALGTAYNEDINCTGPAANLIYIRGRDLYIHFVHAEGGLKVKGMPLYIYTANHLRQFIKSPADVENDIVIVRNVPSDTRFVRYAWEDTPEGGLLYNSADLPAPPFEDMVGKQLLNDGWSFAIGSLEHCEQQLYKPVTLPHDWLISDVNNLYKSGVGWYKRELEGEFSRVLVGGRRMFLCFDGVYMDTTVFVNEHIVGEWKYGYTAFMFDITDFINRDEPNAISVRVNYQSPNSRWYSGAGIYRDVSLVIKNACHLKPNGIYITTRKGDGKWIYAASAEAETGGQPYAVTHTLLSAADTADAIEAWDIDNPRLYTLRTELTVGGCLRDVEETVFGFREIAFTTDSGFFLNGRHIKLNGVCMHHDLGALGAAVHKDAIRRQLTILRDMGVNAIRTSHNPPAKVFMELCDEMGFLVMSEILDMWEKPKTQYDYARFFHEWIERDVASWIRRDRNHPSVIIWSVGNEIYDTHASAERGGELLRQLISLVRVHDPDCNAPITICSNYMPWENTQACADIIKLIGYNYAEYLYDAHHGAHPDWLIYGGETCSTVQSRGVYHFPYENALLADDDMQCSSLGNSTTSWGAKSVETCLQDDLSRPFSLGHFMWTGTDYIGEPTPYHTKNSYFGMADTAGFPKDAYYAVQAAWRHEPMIYLFPCWDFSPGQPVDVLVYTNQPAAELFLNDKSLGTRALNGLLTAHWSVPYEPGVLKAVAYTAGGAAVANGAAAADGIIAMDGTTAIYKAVAAEAYRESFGDAEVLVIESETFGELVFATITTVDSMGRVVENANNRVTVSVENGTLLGLDNGDSTDYDQYQTNSRRLWGGKLLAVARSETGCEARVTAVFDESDIPIRKIELILAGDNISRDINGVFTYNQPSSEINGDEGFVVTAQVYPPNTTYGKTDLLWRLADSKGIDSPLGVITERHGDSCTVVPRADGEISVRCAVHNGKPHADFYSALPILITGKGECLLNPYAFVAGGLYNTSNVPMTNGNERGVATLRDGISHVGFAGLDFGAFGSDTVTFGLFPMSGAPFTFGIWEGMPEEGGVCLLDACYDKGSAWNTYKDITYTLPKRLTGVTTLCLVFNQKVHIKGFIFTKPNKAYEPLTANRSDALYGDDYTVNGDYIEGIGNNVSIAYKGLNFTEGVSTVKIRWRSRREKNSIQLIFTDSNGTQKRVMIDLPGSGNYTEATFPLDISPTGLNDAEILFLPGCEIDLHWLWFNV